VAERFTGINGRYVQLKDTVSGFREILDGKCDIIPASLYDGWYDRRCREKAGWQPGLIYRAPKSIGTM
jgi:hypothetical protein